MIKEIRLPDLGEGIDSAVVSEIPVASGNQISKDEVLLVLESDKASMEIPSDHNGKITEVLIKEGDDVSTNDLLFKMETSDTGSVSKSEESQVAREPEPEPEPELEPKPEPIPMLKPEKSNVGDGVFASPGVRRLARELGVDLGLIRGTGAKGRTTKNDLHGYIKMRMQDGSGSRKPQRESIDFSPVSYTHLTLPTKA